MNKRKQREFRRRAKQAQTAHAARHINPPAYVPPVRERRGFRPYNRRLSAHELVVLAHMGLSRR